MQITRPFILHTLSPLHAGTGQSVDIIDLPIARLSATGIPFLPGSSIKGVLREHHTPLDEEGNQNKKDPKTWALFGPDTANASEHAGALIVGDARLLAMPVRSFRGTFALVTSPLLLQLASRDWSAIEKVLKEHKLPEFGGRGAVVADGNLNTPKNENKVYLEDLDLPVTKHPLVGALGKVLGEVVDKDNVALFTKRLVIVDDETMTFLWETATQIDTRIRLDPTTRTVAEGALWLEESLPAESLLIGVMGATDSRDSQRKYSAAEVLHEVFNGVGTLQFGGKATVGRGRCAIVALPTEKR
jgi:CRISPR-associated protein Cmr4